MEESLIVLGVLLAAGLWLAGNLLGLVAIVKLGGLRRRVSALEAQLELERFRATAASPVPAAAQSRRPAKAAQGDAEAPIAPSVQSTPDAAPEPTHEVSQAALAELRGQPSGSSESTNAEPQPAHQASEAGLPPLDGDTEPGAPGAPPSAGASAASSGSTDDSSTPAPEATPSPQPSLEERLATTWFTRLGAGILILGVAYFFKYAVDNAWIGPLGRVALGVVAGASVLFFAEWMKPKLIRVYFLGLTGLGLSLLYLATFAAYGFYHLLPMPLAFAGLTVVCGIAGALALRQRSQLILIMGLLAALTNPVLLSTGTDRPLALFAYLLVVSIGSAEVSLRLRSVAGLYLARAGVLFLAAAWYLHFFKVDAAISDPVSGLAIPNSGGSYFGLGARLAPALMALAFTASWTVYALRARSASWSQVRPLLLLAIPLGFAPFAAGLLLYDHASLLALSLVLCAAYAGVLLYKEELPALLGLPLAVSFFALLGATNSAREAPLGALLAVLVWLGLYGVATSRSKQGGLRIPTEGPARVVLVAALILTTLLTLLWGGDHPTLLIAAALIFSSLYLFVDHSSHASRTSHAAPPEAADEHEEARESSGEPAAPKTRASKQEDSAPGSGWLSAVGAALTAIMLMVASTHLHGPEGNEAKESPLFLPLVALWALLYLGITLRLLWARTQASEVTEALEPVPGSRSVSLTLRLTGLGAPVAFVGIAMTALQDPGGSLAALCSAGAGLVLFGSGVWLLRLHPGLRRDASLFLGAGLSLVTLALGIALSGPALTLAWAVMATLVAVLAARDDDPRWMAAAAALFVLVLGRVMVIDLPAPWQARDLFLNSLGKEGQFAFTPFLNTRALSMVAVALASLLSARALLQRPDSKHRGLALGLGRSLGVVSYLLLLGWIVLDMRALVFTHPSTQGLLGDSQGMVQLLAALNLAREQQRTLLTLTTTLTLGVTGGLCLGLGFGLRQAITRWMGLLTLCATVLKLAMWDIWSLQHLYQVIVLMGVGALLLAVGFLYARFGKRLLDYFKVGGALLLLLGLGAGAGRAAAQEPGSAKTAGVQPAELFFNLPAAGRYGILVTPGLVRASAFGASLDDLRIEDAEGQRCPFALRPKRAAQAPQTLPATLLDPILKEDGSSEATFDLGANPRRHNRLRLELAQGSFLRHAKLYVSDDRSSWGEIAEGVVMRSRAGGHRLQSLTLSYPKSAARYLKVRLLPMSGEPALRIRGGQLRQETPRSSIPETHINLPIVATGLSKTDPTRSFVALELPKAGWPIEQLEIEVQESAFERRVQLQRSLDGRRYLPVSSGLLVRSLAAAEGQGQTQARPGLRLPAGVHDRYLRLLITNGDDPPLHLTRVQGLTRDRLIIFSTTQGGRHRLSLGAPEREAPHFELGALLDREATAGRPVQAGLPLIAVGPLKPGHPYTATGVRPPPWTEQHPLALGLGLGLLLLLLGLWTLRLLRISPPPSE